MVRGLAALGRACDSRTNSTIVERPCSDARWRDLAGRWSIVLCKEDSKTASSYDLLNSLFGGSHLTLVYNYAETLSLRTLAELLIELYDVKLTGFRTLPTICWYDLTAYEEEAIRALNRIEFQFCKSEVLPAPPTVAKGFDPMFQITSDPVALAAFCHGYMCIEVGKEICAKCGQRLCPACYRKKHSNGQCE
jgi:hypothetical protein